MNCLVDVVARLTDCISTSISFRISVSEGIGMSALTSSVLDMITCVDAMCCVKVESCIDFDNYYDDTC